LWCWHGGGQRHRDVDNYVELLDRKVRSMKRRRDAPGDVVPVLTRRWPSSRPLPAAAAQRRRGRVHQFAADCRGHRAGNFLHRGMLLTPLMARFFIRQASWITSRITPMNHASSLRWTICRGTTTNHHVGHADKKLVLVSSVLALWPDWGFCAWCHNCSFPGRADQFVMDVWLPRAQRSRLLTRRAPD